jgi:hypothetical protein
METRNAEVVVRGAWVVRRLRGGASLAEAIPGAGHPRLRKTLLIAHTGAAAIKAGKVYFTIPLGLNWSQWLALSRYAARETAAMLAGEVGSHRDAAVNAALDDELVQLSARLHSSWTASPVMVGGTSI